MKRPHEWPAPPPRVPFPEVANLQQVAVHGERLVIHAPHIHMTRDEALVHAAWLVTLAERPEDEGRFAAILEVVRKL